MKLSIKGNLYHHPQITLSQYAYVVSLLDSSCTAAGELRPLVNKLNSRVYTTLYTLHSTLHGSIFTKTNFNVTTEPWILMIGRHQKVPNEFFLISLN